MKTIKTLKVMGVLAAMALVFAACNQVTGGGGEDGLTGARKIGQGVGQPTVWATVPLTDLPFMNIPGVTIGTINGVTSDGLGNTVAVAGTSSAAYAATSSNGGANWTTQATALPALPRNPSAVNYIGNQYLVTAGNTATAGAFSPIGTSGWSSTGLIGFGTKGSVYAQNLYVVSGQAGQGAYSSSLSSAFTTITPTYTQWPATSGPPAYINAAAFGEGTEGDMFVFGGGSGYIAYTPTIVSGGTISTWQPATITPALQATDFINVIVYGDGIFVGVGGPNAAPGTHAIAVWSTDGIDWTQASLPTRFGDGVEAYALAYGPWGGDSNNYFVAGDDNGNTVYSTNGMTWNSLVTQVFPAGTPINALTNDSRNQRFIAVGGTTATTTPPFVAYTLP
jgi:predicted small secreted protein